ncbi:Cobalamin (vitamin B12) biosynthesis CobW-like protein [Alteracholeplasma palmae J233]|uniref:Cobalamin (Vitamin B12) biosynthesis CobW-like protein n=1 Tax=Alteracholeplasma palmae (strain ATCC 49389 / J233) TaxID=1318466 RepID=U4KKM8_ALTPJ|nr:GTP-binding protein [Alteracholeplasma palmae]CCV64173.1 Cobalamin (vitamin B12) biosynthesis CobW-like protein [Alteracholeplasma palmae J233]
MENKKIPITILNGYLGAGKTTLLNHLLNNQVGLKIAVIVNDLSEVNIDAKLIEQGTSVEHIKEEMVELSNGCICCSLRSDLLVGITRLVDSKKYDYIIIESSGVTEPIPVAQTIIMGQTEDGRDLSQLCYIDSMLTVVDALRMKTEFNLGQALEEHGHEHEEHHHDHHHDDEEEKPIAGLLVEQLEFCNIVLLNKTDLVSKEELAIIKSYIKKIQPEATLIETKFGKVPFDQILNTHSFNLKTVANSAGWIQELDGHDHEEAHDHASEYGISSFVYRRKRPFDIKKLGLFYDYLPRSIVRTKGVIWLDINHDYAFMISQAGESMKFEEFGLWLGSRSEEDIQAYLKNSEKLRKNWDEYHDRQTELVIIGIHMDQKEVETMLDNALMTKEELETSWNEYLKIKNAK